MEDCSDSEQYLDRVEDSLPSVQRSNLATVRKGVAPSLLQIGALLMERIMATIELTNLEELDESLTCNLNTQSHSDLVLRCKELTRLNTCYKKSNKSNLDARLFAERQVRDLSAENSRLRTEISELKVKIRSLGITSQV